MKRFYLHYRLGLLLSLLLGSFPGPAAGQEAGSARLKDLVLLEGAAPVQLIGYGLVVGLDRTGDRAQGRRGSPYTVQSITNMLRRFGITVDPALLTSRNAAAVIVTTTIDAFHAPGSAVDVTVSSLGDARSLSGGVLLQTPLLNPASGDAYAMAQGPVTTGGISAAAAGSSVKVNHTNTGRIPSGALVTGAAPFQFTPGRPLGLVLKRPDFTNAVRIAEGINTAHAGAARVEHAGLIRITLPASAQDPAAFLAELERLPVAVDVPARVVVNERTGTIVAGGAVRISEVMVTHGGIVVSTQADPVVSQPAPLSQGETVSRTAASITVDEDRAQSLVLPPNTNVTELAAALNDLGLPARDVIAIFQAIDRAGALQGELIIL